VLGALPSRREVFFSETRRSPGPRTIRLISPPGRFLLRVGGPFFPAAPPKHTSPAPPFFLRRHSSRRGSATCNESKHFCREPLIFGRGDRLGPTQSNGGRGQAERLPPDLRLDWSVSGFERDRLWRASANAVAALAERRSTIHAPPSVQWGRMCQRSPWARVCSEPEEETERDA